MVHIELREFGQDEWNGIVSSMDALSLMQTWEFGEAKAKTGNWTVSRAVFRKGAEIVGAAQFAIRTIPVLNRGLVWVNRAPLLANGSHNETDVYLEILEELRRHWMDKRKMYLRMAPPLAASEENYALVQRAGYSRATSTDGWISEMLDLDLSVDELRKNLDGKWRNCLSKAERCHVECEIGSTDDLMDELLGDYEALLARIGSGASLPPALVRSLQELLPPSRKMVICAARQAGRRLGSILIAPYSDKSMYLIGAINDEGRKVNANHHLIWNAICEMKRRGVKWFDLGGVHPDDTPPGILHFKRGIRGTPYRLMGDVDAMRDGWLNRMIRARIGNRR